MLPAAIARSPIVPLFAEPSLRAEQVSQLILGETASVLQSDAEWRRLRSSLDGYEGWAHAGYVLEVDESTADRWRSDAGGWSLGAVVRMGENPMRIPLRAPVSQSTERPFGCQTDGVGNSWKVRCRPTPTPRRRLGARRPNGGRSNIFRAPHTNGGA